MLIFENELMSKHTTMRIGGPCKYLIICEHMTEMVFGNGEMLANNADLFFENPDKFSEKFVEDVFVYERKIIGNGSNLLVPDKGYDGIVVKIKADVMELIPEKNTILVSADKKLSDVCIFARNNSLAGMEWAYGIPGTIGGAVYMNAGAYGGEMKDIVSFVNGRNSMGKSYDESGAYGENSQGKKHGESGISERHGENSQGKKHGEHEISERHGENSQGEISERHEKIIAEKFEIGRLFSSPDSESDPGYSFGYRHSSFMDSGEVIEYVEIKLEPGDKNEINSKMKSFIEKRKLKQPLEYPSSGSFFKRPCNVPGNEVYAAKLIEDCGLKGLQIGGAQVSEKHAGFIVNKGGATFDDIMRLADTVRERVLSITGYELQIEPEILK